MKPSKQTMLGYALALFTVLVWGATFIASKQLLVFYTPARIMLMRFILAYIALWIIRPRPLLLPWKTELRFAALGIAGCSIYFLTENTALLHTTAANVSIIVSAAPIITAIIAHFATDEKLHRNTLLGFLVAFSGVVLVVFNGAFVLRVSPKGDILALLSACCWATYSVMLRKMPPKLDPILVTRRTMLWGLITAVPMAMPGGAFSLAPLAAPLPLFDILFLGLIGSALCYVLWGKAFTLLGVVATNNCLYLIPFVTIVMAGLTLKEPISPAALGGAVLITAGVVLAQRRKDAQSSQEEQEPPLQTPREALVEDVSEEA
ncbi:DMT family transporter [Oscillibacter sp.]|uniref:DMT family transporter n=1 Tax=Oscillibacter sp. TaxID=1945593 RepID=UPI0028A16005|nr:DMT family transporter [Oscillibacter sp.]